MKIQNKTIYFKSSSTFFTKELKGIKNNTVRSLTRDETIDIRNYIDDIEFIGIESVDTGLIFVRELTDISFYADRWIFTWRSNELD